MSIRISRRQKCQRKHIIRQGPALRRISPESDRFGRQGAKAGDNT